ncbi:hypothetical protein VTK73DRAFT_6362 [Phialemonium thermophilum]|uniref:Uncharacterized protein n=1 Tax=Phialemonium thermophilum TaxID=223376 RepID=A0ABR3WJL4_9PEZI
MFPVHAEIPAGIAKSCHSHTLVDLPPYENKAFVKSISTSHNTSGIFTFRKKLPFALSELYKQTCAGETQPLLEISHRTRDYSSEPLPSAVPSQGVTVTLSACLLSKHRFLDARPSRQHLPHTKAGLRGKVYWSVFYSYLSRGVCARLTLG